MELRPYQQAAREAVEGEWKEGRRRTLLVLPTGCGKTIVFANIAADCVRQGDRVLILAHRGELLEQAAAYEKKFDEAMDGGDLYRQLVPDRGRFGTDADAGKPSGTVPAGLLRYHHHR